MVRSASRFALVWLLNITLSVVLSLTLPPAWSFETFSSSEQEAENYESERYERRSMPHARLKPHNDVVTPVLKTKPSGNTVPDPEFVILPVLCILFCPLIYKWLLRQWLDPLKFTSKFVDPTRLI
ncbi:hypothetical protein A8L34_11345 [Bacillus sp. FJAT-27264]|uniref:hypothetical protein n=1 Tax=Paenibacillus sp. (strain DSM 101736 / FJAT-27264) TaxID=1850362 RepID=UPI000807F432|nr:hypothetical protein [Bacillus sp. FJAT-27264]OBZ14517.1 hypothetical protein A8L34_11345 [Bacillus sp. FJAT-27264]